MNTFEHDDMMKKKKLNNTCSLLIMLLVYLHFTCKTNWSENRLFFKESP